MINISNITKSYNGNYNAVSNLNLEIRDGEIYGLLGPNGAGKTTTIKMITGIISPTSGKLKLTELILVKSQLEQKSNLVMFQIARICF